MCKFYADSMLGKLSRFLRFLGYDTTYRSQESVYEMLETADKENRIILTRSQEIIQMCQKRNLDKLFISGTEITQQLKETKENFSLKIIYPPLKVRCSVCNGELIKRSKEEIIDQLHERTAKHYDEFWECLECSKIYWMGSHWQDIKKTICELEGSE